MNYARKRILVNTKAVDFEQFDNKTLTEFIDYFIDVRESSKDDFPDLEPMVSVYSYGDSEYEVQLNFYENETDEVYNRRVEYLEHLRKTKEDYKTKVSKSNLDEEWKLYDEIKNKFDGV